MRPYCKDGSVQAPADRVPGRLPDEFPKRPADARARGILQPRTPASPPRRAGAPPPAPYVSHSSTVRHNVHRARTRPRTGTLIR